MHAEMRGPLLLLTAKDEEVGYTLIELLMVVVLISVLGGTFLQSHSSSFVSYKKLRLAASELAGAMAKARDTAARNINVESDCSVTLTVNSTTTAVTTSLYGTTCFPSTLLPGAINIRDRAGASSLVVDQTIVIKFLSEGMSINSDASADTSVTDQTVRLSDPRSPTVVYVNLTIPASIIRLGLIKAGSTSCDYTAK